MPDARDNFVRATTLECVDEDEGSASAERDLETILVSSVGTTIGLDPKSPIRLTGTRHFRYWQGSYRTFLEQPATDDQPAKERHDHRTPRP